MIPETGGSGHSSSSCSRSGRSETTMRGTWGKRRKRERSWSPGCRMLQIFKLSYRIGAMDVDNVVAGVIVDD